MWTYAGSWFSTEKKMASKAWRSYRKLVEELPAKKMVSKVKAVEEPPSKKLGWARLNEILGQQIQKNMAFNAQKKKEEEELRVKLELLKKEEENKHFRCYMTEEVNETFTPEVDRRTQEWVAKVPNWTIEAGTRVWTYDGPWYNQPAQKEEPEKHYDLAGNGWIFDSTKYLASQLLRLLPCKQG